MLASLVCHPAARAAIFTVGADAGCTHQTLDAAIAALPASGQHEVHIAIPSLSAQAVHITSRDVTIRGGYGNCSASESSGFTTLSGQGGGQDSVITIRGSGNDVILERVNLIRGDEVNDGYGGGLDFKGTGLVILRNMGISQNFAGYGGGISFISDGGLADLRIESGTVIQLNTAQFSGGGIRLEGNVYMTMLGTNSTILGNEARGLNPDTNQPQYGYGGGIQVLAPAIADIGSPGIGNGTIVANTARYGGGIALNVGDSNGYVQVNVFSTDRAQPTRLYGNRASNTGGAVYADARADFATGNEARFCAFDTRFDGNIAQEGSVIYLDTDNFLTDYFGARAHLNNDSLCDSHPLRVRCGPQDQCNTIEGNRAEDANGQATSGAVITVQNDAFLTLGQLIIRDNTGGHVLHGFDDAYTFMHSLLVVGNSTTSDLVRIQDDGGSTALRDSTLAGNTIGSGNVLSINGTLEISRSIIWQPGLTTLAHNSEPLLVENTIASESDSLGGSPGARVAFPRFVDPDRGDFQLRAASPAIDYVDPVNQNPWDVVGVPRNRRLDVVPREVGLVRDIGAYERPSLLPLVLNGDFDADSNLWPATTAGVSSWDGTQNAAGAASSGSIKVTRAGTPNQQRVYGLNQCIHLPGPGIYALNGWGRAGSGGTGNRDYLYLNWELRHDGGEGCSSGPADASGDHFLSNSSNWQHPVNPKLIAISDGDWTSNSSLFITQVVTEFGITNPPTTIGWFDGITLDLQLDDTIFEDGFEPAL